MQNQHVHMLNMYFTLALNYNICTRFFISAGRQQFCQEHLGHTFIAFNILSFLITRQSLRGNSIETFYIQGSINTPINNTFIKVLQFLKTRDILKTLLVTQPKNLHKRIMPLVIIGDSLSLA